MTLGFLRPAAMALAGFIGVPAAAAQARPTAEQRAEAERRIQAELRAPRPIEAAASLWIDELTWMEVRDLIAAGTTTVIIATGGVEQNGPYLTTGKHNVILRGACEAIARKLGKTLCAPVVAFVPEGNFDPPTGHMRYPGTISLREDTYRQLIEDIATSFKTTGFTEIILIGDSGGNQTGLAAAATNLNAAWGAAAKARYIPEFYQYDKMVAYMNDELGVKEPIDEGYHDSYWITALMMAVDPSSVRYDQRIKAGKASINGVSIADKTKTAALGWKLFEFRANHTVKAIAAARAKG
ncbi:MAG: creatininase [Gemmatimonadetes bacterium]|nr:creatininase [Gemmatimonadota bacterium]